MKIEIIAELAQGFEGRPEQARLLVQAAATAGADAAKLQLVYADELATPDYKHYELFRSLEMADDVWVSLAQYAAELGIQLHFDIFGTRSLQLAERIGAGALKLHGTDIANIGLLTEVANSSVHKVLLGAGGAFTSEIQQAIEILSSKDVVVLLGFQGYPTPTDANQISRVRLLSDQLTRSYSHVTVGFADHASPDNPLSYALAAMAIGAGAKVLEKHLTLGRVMKLEDHEAALSPDEFVEFARTIRGCSEAMGIADDCIDFGMSKSEHDYRAMIRRHVVAIRNLDPGMVIAPSDLTLKRTSSDNPITDLALVYSRSMKRGVQINAPLSLTDIE